MKMLSWVLSWLCLLMKMQTLQTVKTAPSVPIKGENKSLKNVTIPNPKPSSDIRIFLKEHSIKGNKLLQKQKAMYPVTLSDLIVIA